MKLVVFLPNWLGDLAMATPTLRALRRHFGRDARIVGIMRPYLADVLNGTDWLDEQWFFERRSKDRSLRAGAVARRMRAERFDMAVLLTNSFRTAAIAWWGRARRRVGYAMYGRGPLLTDRLRPRRSGRRLAPAPVVDTYLALARAAVRAAESRPSSPRGRGASGPGSDDLDSHLPGNDGTWSRRLELATTEADERSADVVFETLGLRDDGRVITLNSSGAYGGSKLWPVEYFAHLARRVVEELDHDVLVMCGPKEREIARQVVRLANTPRAVSMADQPLDLGTAKACIGRSRLMVSTDSGPRHVAAALDKPVVTMFGPMVPAWSENPTQRAANLMLDLDCIGCHKRVCPLGHHRCMNDLSVDMVFGEVVGLLEQDSAAAA